MLMDLACPTHLRADESGLDRLIRCPKYKIHSPAFSEPPAFAIVGLSRPLNAPTTSSCREALTKLVSDPPSDLLAKSHLRLHKAEYMLQVLRIAGPVAQLQVGDPVSQLKGAVRSRVNQAERYSLSI
jgi:hypothetical protein